MKPEPDKMQTRSAQEQINEALLEPERTLPEEILGEMTVQQRATYDAHRTLETELVSAFAALSEAAPLRVPASIAVEDQFRERLQASIEAQTAQPAPGLADFFRRAKRRDFVARLKEIFLYNPSATYRWAPAVIVLLILPLIPLIKDAQKDRATAHAGDSLPFESLAPSEGSLDQKKSPPDKAGARSTPRKSTAHRPTTALKKEVWSTPGPVQKPAKRSAKKKADTGARRAAELSSPQATARAKVAASAAEEASLQARLKQAKTKAQRVAALEKLAAFYKQNGQKSKLSAVRKQLRSLR